MALKILDPRRPFLQRWNKIFVLSCIIAVSLDPLFFYIPVINDDDKCLYLDKKLEATVSILRFLNDLFYLIHIIFQFRTGFIAPSSRVFGRGVFVEDVWEITKKYLSSYFFIDILSVLPLPQVVILVVIPKLNGATSLNTTNLLKFVVMLQYIPRVLRVYPLYKQVSRLIHTETVWFGNFFSIFLYMLAGHGIGALWYFFSIEREIAGWKEACRGQSDCRQASLYCEADHTGYRQFLNNSCDPIQESNGTCFDLGIFLKPLQSGVVGSTSFPHKFFYCLWWGLRNLSSLGQNLQTSTHVGEICFAFFISISGQMLIAFVIGTQLQSFLKSITTRSEEMRVKMRETEQWMSYRLLPEGLRERIRRYEQYKWQVTRGVDEEDLIRKLPKDLRRDIKRHLRMPFLKRVPTFAQMDEQLLDEICDRLKPVLYTEGSFIVREGEPVDEMLFILRGKLLTVTTNGGRNAFFNSADLRSGDFCGEEILTWALDPHSSNLPISTRNVQAVSEVEAFALVAGDWKFVASQFRRLQIKQIRHTFRFYSPEWRTWATRFIQTAWRRYYKKKLEQSLCEEENRMQDALVKGGGSSPSLGATIYASRFAANALRLLRRNGTKKARIPKDIAHTD